jgi:hypothetical protein
MAALVPAASVPPLGAPLRLTFAPERLHVFDKTTGLSLTGNGLSS